MRQWVGRTLVFVAALGVASCASVQDKEWYQKSRDIAAKATDKVSTATTAAYTKMQHYLAEKDVLEKFHDAGVHSEDAVLDVLHKAGVGGNGSKNAVVAGGAPAKPAKPGKNAPPALPAPEHYDGQFRWPLDAGIVSSEFGGRWGKMHKGIDIAADVGESVHAAAPGEVIYAGNGLTGYGNVVILRHGQMTTLYAHNSALKVRQGDKVQQGQEIALLGNTGHSTGPHVHFEIREGDSPINPRSLLPKQGMVAAVDYNHLISAYAYNAPLVSRDDSDESDETRVY